MSDCCSVPGTPKYFWQRFDLLLWGSLIGVTVFYLLELLLPQFSSEFSKNIFELINKMWWGLFLGIIFVGILNVVPREFVQSILGKGGTISGIFRATLAGVLLDLCSHGILMVGMKLYERGASLGQMMAFLIASPWNSFSLTLILWALIGFKWTLVFLIFSMVIAIISGLIFEKLVDRKILPPNPNKQILSKDFKLWPEIKKIVSIKKLNGVFLRKILIDGILGSKMVLKWVFFGVILASVIRVVFSPETFETFFGPTLAGLGLTVVVATVIEVCSEGSTPIAADLLVRANAPGNSFAFLMTGVSTDYTEIMSIKSTTKSWKIALFLPLVTVPQVLFLAWLMNVL